MACSRTEKLSLPTTQNHALSIYVPVHTPTFSSVALSPKHFCIDICMNVIYVLCCYVYFMAIVQSYVVGICMSVVCLVLLRTLCGFVENVIVVRTRKK